jgi:hypothetical protein
MNRYQIRKKLQALKQKDKSNMLHVIRSTHIDRVITQYEDAYLAYFLTKPRVTYKYGWYRVKGRGFYREANLLKMADAMLAELAEESLGK